MKKAILLVSISLLTLTGSFAPVLAVPIGTMNHSAVFRYPAADLDRWCAGIYARSRERNITHNRVIGLEAIKTSKTQIYVGYDFNYWFTTYILAAGGEVSSTISAGSAFDIGWGFRFQLLDHELRDPWLAEDRIRITAAIQQTYSGAELRGQDEQWMETYANLILSIVNDIDGNKLFLPDAISFFAGPIFSDIESRGFSSRDVDEYRMFGFTAGIEIFLSDRVSLEIEAENLGFSTVSYGIHVQF